MPTDLRGRTKPVGELLKELRGGTSLREVYKRTGISHAYLCNMEQGIKKPGYSVLHRLAACYGVSLQLLLDAAGLPTGLPEETEEDRVANIERSYEFVLSDPLLKNSPGLKEHPTLETKRFIVDLYQRITGKTLL
jgi:transcriptional regulator with XRE-family HTH domain